MNINRSTVFDAKTVLKHGTPEEIEAGEAGNATRAARRQRA